MTHPSLDGRVPLFNRGNEASLPASGTLGLGFSYRVRLGLREPDDPIILASLEAFDATLKVDFPDGGLHRRYQGDGYGEHADGSAYDGQGLGRAWPLLAGERGHLVLCPGEAVAPCLAAMLGAAGPAGLIPERVWGADDIPQRGLFRGRPAGSAVPPVWAHAEFLKLVVANERRAPVARLSSVSDRYDGGKRPAARAWRWRDEGPMDCLPADRDLVIEAGERFALHYRFDDASGMIERVSVEQPFRLHGVRLASSELTRHGGCLTLTRSFADRPERAEWKVRLGMAD